MSTDQIKLVKYHFDIGCDVIGFSGWVIAATRQEAVVVMRHRASKLLTFDDLNFKDSEGLVSAYFDPGAIQEKHIDETLGMMVEPV
jgi:hypothetical protein